MALKLVWTEDALNSFEEILDYLELRFGKIVASKYAKRIEKFTVQLLLLPTIGALQDGSRNIRGVIVNKRSTILYTFDENNLIILNVFDNRIPLKS